MKTSELQNRIIQLEESHIKLNQLLATYSGVCKAEIVAGKIHSHTKKVFEGLNEITSEEIRKISIDVNKHKSVSKEMESKILTLIG